MGTVQLVAEAGNITEGGVAEAEVDTRGTQGIRLLWAEVDTRETQGSEGTRGS